MTDNASFLARRNTAIPRGLATAAPIFLDKAEGGELWDIEGHRYVDFASGIAVTNTGHRHPRVMAAAAAQAEKFAHVCFQVTGYPGYVELAERLNALAPIKNAKSIFFTTGAEATENAVKIARSFTKRQAIVVFEHGYHGRTNLTMGMTAKNMPYKDSFGPFTPEIYRMPMAYPYRWEGGAAACEKNALDVVIHKLDKEIGGKNIAAIVIEPIQGEGGFIVPPKGFLPGLAKYAKDNGALFIADEVQTGFARTGQMFASEDENLEPDLITTAKGIAGGLPLAAVTGRADVMDSIHASGLGGTYGGSPIACAAALGAIKTIEEDKLIDRAKKIGTIMSDELNKMKAKHAIIGEVRGRGAMQAIELVEPGTKTPNTAAMSAVVKYCQSKGVLVLTAGTYSNVVRFLPPIVITDELLKDALSVLDEAFASL